MLRRKWGRWDDLIDATSFTHNHLMDSLSWHINADEGKLAAHKKSTQPISFCLEPFHSNGMQLSSLSHRPPPRCFDRDPVLWLPRSKAVD